MSNRFDSKLGRPRVTLQQVAQATGLSRTTVCDILHRGVVARSYNKDTRRRVQQAMRDLGYIPSLAARQLRRGRSGQIGLLLTTEFSGQFFARVAATVERELRARGLRLQIAVTNGDPQTEYQQMVRLQEDEVEGLVVGPIYDSADLQLHRTFFQGRLPTVLFGGTCGSEFDEVALDHVTARRLAAKHLLSMGHRRIGFLCAPRSRATNQISGDLRQEWSRLGIEDLTWIVVYSMPRSTDDCYREALEFARRWTTATPSERPSAMVCLNDEVAMTALSALARFGVSVPRDLSLVGCDNIPETQYLRPPLTTVDNHAEQQMQHAVKLLLERIERPTKKRVVKQVAPTLIERESVRRLGP